MISINLKHHQYNIMIQKGCLNDVGNFVKQLWNKEKVTIITDETVYKLYGEYVKYRIEKEGYEVHTIVVKPGEKSKSLATAEYLYRELAKVEMTRSDGIIALGGGVIGDLAGFVASTYMRGIDFIQIPTTLLSQVDSSIGGKTAVNTSDAKNLVGTFSHPDGVLIDPEVLQTLDIRRKREGIAEIVKAAAIADRHLWDTLSQFQSVDELLNNCESVITASLNIKKQVVEADELDNSQRLTLNFGHTIGHALENTLGYNVISHGEGVAVGMCMISKHAEKIGLSPRGITEEIEAMLKHFGLPTTIKYDSKQVYQSILHDKKARGNDLKIITLERLGSAKIHTIPIESIKNFIV